MGNFVTRELDEGILKKARTNHIAEGMVFFVEGENRGGWDAWRECTISNSGEKTRVDGRKREA